MESERTGAERIAIERQRQIVLEGWSAEHDDKNKSGSIAWAAVCYAAPKKVFTVREYAKGPYFMDPWPWESRWDKRITDPTNEQRIRELEKAGALIAAEIDRLLRLEPDRGE